VTKCPEIRIFLQRTAKNRATEIQFHGFPNAIGADSSRTWPQPDSPIKRWQLFAGEPMICYVCAQSDGDANIGDVVVATDF